jgi:hypothetical protein
MTDDVTVGATDLAHFSLLRHARRYKPPGYTSSPTYGFTWLSWGALTS